MGKGLGLNAAFWMELDGGEAAVRKCGRRKNERSKGPVIDVAFLVLT